MREALVRFLVFLLHNPWLLGIAGFLFVCAVVCFLMIVGRAVSEPEEDVQHG